MAVEENGSYEYDMSQFLPPCPVKYENVPEFEGPIEIVKNVPGKGRGIKATEDISRGQLVMVSRAFAVSFNYKENEQDWLTNAAVKTLTAEPTRCHEVYELFAGKKLGFISPTSIPTGPEPGPNDCKHTPWIDVERIRQIYRINGFGSINTRGLWILPSYFNHDCIDFNCRWKVLGDLIFVRASRFIRKNEELLICYIDSLTPFEQRLEFFKFHDFICECRLCMHQMSESPLFKKRKVEILFEVEALLKCGNWCAHEIETIVKDIENRVTEFQMIGAASGKPEWNFNIRFLLFGLLGMYYKAGNLHAVKVNAEKYYQVVNGSAQKDGEGSVCLDIGAASLVANLFLKCGDFEGARQWIYILKNDLCSIYGNSDVLKLVCPNLCTEAVKNGIECETL